MPDSSLKFAIGPPRAPKRLRLSLLAGQSELERLHVLDLLVLKGFLDFDSPEVAGLLQVRNQIGYRIGAQSRAFQIYAGAGIVHLAQPDGFGVVDRLADHRHQIDRPAILSGAQLINYIHAALVGIGLALSLQVASFDVG